MGFFKQSGVTRMVCAPACALLLGILIAGCAAETTREISEDVSENASSDIRSASPEPLPPSPNQASLFSSVSKKPLTKDQIRDTLARKLEKEVIELLPSEKGWTIKGVLPQNDTKAPPEEIADIRKMQLEKAIPSAKEEGPLLQSLADLSKESDLSLKWIKENQPTENTIIGEYEIATFQITIQEEGLVKDLLRFPKAFKKLSRQIHLVKADIEQTDIRSGIEIGKGSFVLEAYHIR